MREQWRVDLRRQALVDLLRAHRAGLAPSAIRDRLGLSAVEWRRLASLAVEHGDVERFSTQPRTWGDPPRTRYRALVEQVTPRSTAGRIVAILADAWEPVTVADLSARIGYGQCGIRARLARLEAEGLAIRIPRERRTEPDLWVGA